MNVLFINTLDNIGGAAKVAYRLKSKLEKDGHTANMLVHHKTTDDPSVSLLRQSPKHRQLAELLATDIDFFPSDEILLTQQYKEADIVHCHNLHGWYFKLSTLKKMARDKPVFWTLHDEWAIMPHGVWDSGKAAKRGFYHRHGLKGYPEMRWNNQLYLELKKQYLYRTSLFETVVPSDWLYQKVLNTKLNKRPLNLVYNGIDTSVFKYRDTVTCRKELGLPQKKKIVAFVSNAGKDNFQKGWNHFEKVARHFADKEDLLFMCIGGSDEQEDDSSNIKFVSYVKDEVLLSKYYSAADLFLFTSSNENFPLVTLEAMSAGTPIVSFDVGGTKEAVDEGVTGYIVPHGNVSKLIKSIEHYLSLTPNAREQVSLAASKTVNDRFSIDTMYHNYKTLYEQALLNRN